MQAILVIIRFPQFKVALIVLTLILNTDSRALIDCLLAPIIPVFDTVFTNDLLFHISQKDSVVLAQFDF